MNLLKKLLLAATAMIGLAQCETNHTEFSDVVIIVSPGADKPQTLYAGEKTLYSVQLMTPNDFVASLKVTSFDPQNGIQPVYEDAFHQKEITLNVPFSAPALNRDSVEVLLTFQASDNIGNRAEITRRVLVLNKAIAMAEKTGIVLYSPASGLADALELENISHPFSLADAPDSTHADIFIQASEDFENISWHSNTKAKFLRNNSFDYASATPSAIQSVFESSVRTDVVNDIRINDIILVGHGNKAQGVFYVANIIRDTNPKCIQLSFKGIVQ